MSDYDVGFGKTPIHSRWKRGQSGNPKGRSLRKPVPLAEQISEVLDAPIKYRESGQTRTASGRELGLRMMVDRAANGDIGAAEDILKVRQQAERQGDIGARIIMVENWLPDHPGQTTEEKARAAKDAHHEEPGAQSLKSQR